MPFSTRQSITISVVGSYVGMVAQFLSTLILARLLTPEDIGIFGAGFTVIALAHLFRDFGLNQYIIQEKNLTQEKLSATFSLSLIIAWSLGLMVFLVSGLAAEFFQEPDIGKLLKLLSINFFAIPFGSITIALLRKNLKFHISTSIGIAATILGTAVTLWSAFQGAQYFSMAYGAITETLSVVLLSLLFRPKGLNLTPGLKGIKTVFHFGSMVGVGNIVSQFTHSTSDALIAKLLGTTSLGFFSRAFGTYSLFDKLFLSGIRPTILPLFSASNNNPKELAEAYYRSVSYTAVLAWPFFIFMVLYTAELIHILYGYQWDMAIPLVKILASGALVMPVIFFSDNLFIACGKPQIPLKITIITGLVKLSLIVPACLISLEAVCIVFVIFFVTKTGLSLYYLQVALQARLQRIISIILTTAIVTGCTILPSLLVYQLIGEIASELTRLSLLMITACIGWLLGLIFVQHEFYNELQRFLPLRKPVTSEHKK